jgi:hypothetical protein
VYGNLCEPWQVIWCGDVSGISPEVTGIAVESASEILWNSTGRRFGNCSVTLRPCRRDCPGFSDDLIFRDGVIHSGSWGWPSPTLVGGEWINLACGVCVGDCACKATSEVLFPDPVIINEIEVDGIVLTEDIDWVLYDGQRLVRIGSEWPRCQDWEAVEGEGTFKVVVQVGAEVPSLGQMAVGVLALEIAKLCEGKPCNLPPQVQRVIRQGVTHETLDPDEPMLTGFWIPDRFIRTYNPNLLQDRARAYSPDVKMPSIQNME